MSKDKRPYISEKDMDDYVESRNNYKNWRAEREKAYWDEGYNDLDCCKEDEDRKMGLAKIIVWIVIVAVIAAIIKAFLIKAALL